MKHRVKEAREAKGLSQLALSELVGVSLTSVQNWESGRGAPSSGRLKKLSQALGRPIRWFVDDEVDATFDNIAQAEVKAEASTEQRLLSMLEKQQALMTEQLALAERQRSDIANLGPSRHLRPKKGGLAGSRASKMMTALTLAIMMCTASMGESTRLVIIGPMV